MISFLLFFFFLNQFGRTWYGNSIWILTAQHTLLLWWILQECTLLQETKAGVGGLAWWPPHRASSPYCAPPREASSMTLCCRPTVHASSLWPCCQQKIITCHLLLQGLSHWSLQLLTFNTPSKRFRAEIRNEALCALRKLPKQAFRYSQEKIRKSFQSSQFLASSHV